MLWVALARVFWNGDKYLCNLTSLAPNVHVTKVPSKVLSIIYRASHDSVCVCVSRAFVTFSLSIMLFLTTDSTNAVVAGVCHNGKLCVWRNR